MLLPEEIDDTLRREELRRSKHDHTNLNRVKALHRKKTNADLSKREDSFQWNNRCVYIAFGLRCDWIGENGTTRARDRKSASVFVVPLARWHPFTYSASKHSAVNCESKLKYCTTCCHNKLLRLNAVQFSPKHCRCWHLEFMPSSVPSLLLHFRVCDMSGIFCSSAFVFRSDSQHVFCKLKTYSKLVTWSWVDLARNGWFH